MSLRNIIATKGVALAATSAQLTDATTAGRALLTATTPALQLAALTGNLITVSGSTLVVAGTVTGAVSASTLTTSAALTAGDSSTNVPTTAFLASNIVRSDLTQTLTAQQRQVARYNQSAPPWDAYAYQNIAYNPRHVISQINGSASVASVNGYVTDGYSVITSGIVCSAQRVSSPFTTRPDLQYGLQATITTAKSSLSSGDLAILTHNVEGTRLKRLLFGTTNAQNMAFGVMLKSSVSGNFYIAFRNNAVTQTFYQKVALTANVETFVPLIIPGSTTGTWATDVSTGMIVAIIIALGSSYQNSTVGSWVSGNYLGGTDQTNLAATASATFTMSDLILLPVPATVTDPTTLFPADRLPFFQRQDDDELRICQRYYFTSDSHWQGYYTANVGEKINQMLPVSMRAVPTWSYALVGGTSGYPLSIGVAEQSTTQSAWVFTAGGTAGALYVNITIYLDARM